MVGKTVSYHDILIFKMVAICHLGYGLHSPEASRGPTGITASAYTTFH